LASLLAQLGTAYLFVLPAGRFFRADTLLADIRFFFDRSGRGMVVLNEVGFRRQSRSFSNQMVKTAPMRHFDFPLFEGQFVQ